MDISKAHKLIKFGASSSKFSSYSIFATIRKCDGATTFNDTVPTANFMNIHQLVKTLLQIGGEVYIYRHREMLNPQYYLSLGMKVV
jgi:aspartate aminotransferase-like enzyme